MAEVMDNLLKHVRRSTGLRNVCLAGGVGQNSSINARIKIPTGPEIFPNNWQWVGLLVKPIFDGGDWFGLVHVPKWEGFAPSFFGDLWPSSRLD